jgi:hypothetical protein
MQRPFSPTRKNLCVFLFFFLAIGVLNPFVGP